MLKQLFTSNTRVKLLTLFLTNPDEEFFIRELTRKLDEQINSIRRELDNLKKIGLLRTKTKNRKKYYTVNKDFMLFSELKAIIHKAHSNKESIVKHLAEFGEVDVVVLSGLFVDKEAPIDILMVGRIDRRGLEDYFNKEMQTKRPVRFSLMTKEEYQYRRKCNDKFLHDILEDQDNIVALNKIA